MKLALTEYPDAAPDGAPPLIVAHGLFGASRNWRALAKRLGPGRLVVAVDLRNHGDSPWDAVQTYPAMAADLAEVVERFGGRSAILGHSMGGKVAMQLAQTRPDVVERLIVADIAPVDYPPHLMPHVEAMSAVDLSACARRGDVEKALEPAIAEAAVRSFLAQNVDFSGDAARWVINLAAIRDQMPAISGYPDTGGVYPGPTLFLSGAASDYVKPAHRGKMDTLFPNARHEAIEGAGHWLHAEKPKAFLAAANAFLA